MPHPGLALGHRVLPVAETGQNLRQEVIERGLRLLRRRRPAESLQLAEVIGKQPGDIVHGLTGHRVGRKPFSVGRRHPPRQPLAVLRVEVPARPLRLVAIHQQARLASHLAIEELHAQLPLVLGPGLEPNPGADEPVIRSRLDSQANAFAPGPQPLGQPPFTALGHHDPLGPQLCDRPIQFAGYRPGITGLIDANVAHRHAPPLQPGRELPHGGEREGDLLLVMAHIGRLAHHLGHEDGVDARIEIGERGQAAA